MENPLKESLSTEFQKLLDINKELESSSLSVNDSNYQEKVISAIDLSKQMTEHVNLLGIFSANESVLEISTEHLKFLLLPALLASFTLKKQSHNRVDILETAEIYFKDFINRLNDYEICDVKLNQNKDDEKIIENKIKIKQDSLINSAQQRNSKIQKYREKKELENKLSELNNMISEQKKNGLVVDEDLERNFYLELINRWLNEALDELSTIEMEKPMAQMRASMLASNQSNNRKFVSDNKKNSKLIQPILITKNKMQKEVYGLGYPSMPTFTVDEFVEQKLKEGSLKLEDKKIYNNSLYDWVNNPDQKKQEDETEAERKESLIEKDDPRKLENMRQWDEFKDIHRRGEGNRHNMG